MPSSLSVVYHKHTVQCLSCEFLITTVEWVKLHWIVGINKIIMADTDAYQPIVICQEQNV